MSETTEQMRRRHEQRQQIREAVSAMVNEDGFRRWLETRSKFHRYSFYNCVLIAMQCPDATHVAGYKAWQQKFERQVRKGERAIRILAPITVKKTDTATGTERYVTVGFRGVSVFDVSQTDGSDLPTPPECVPAEGDCLAVHRSALEGLARELGYLVTYGSTGSGALGYCDPIGRRIVVDSALPANAQVSVLVHELAHASPQKPPLRDSPAPHRSPRLRDKRSATASTDQATASSTARSTRSSSHASAPIPPRSPTSRRRLHEGKTRREAHRCLKRYLARSLYRLLEQGPPHAT